MTRREVRTFCRVCEPACGLVAEVSGGRLEKLRPDKQHPVTAGFACHKGLAGVDIHHDPDRVDRPQRRRSDGSFEAVSWDEALGEIGERTRAILDRHGPDGFASYLGNPLAFNTLAGPGIGAFLSQLGVRHAFGSGTQDCANKFAAGEAVFGTATLHPVPDIERTHHLLCLGSNPRVSHMSFLAIADPVRVLRDAVRRGATVRHVNPRRIEPEAAGLGEVVPIRPDTDVYLLAAMLEELDRSGRFREDVLARHGRNVDGLRAFVGRYPAERVAPVTGIAAEDIRRMARELADAPSAAVYMSTGVNMGRQGTLAYWLLFMLSLVTGNLDRPGGNLYSLGFYPAPKAGRGRPERSFFDSPWGRLRRIRGSLPGNLLPEYLTGSEPDIRGMFVVAGNPVLSVGGEARMREALSGLELLVCVDLYRNATGELADFVLPAADMFERRDINITGLGLQHRPYVQYTEAVVPPRGERREEWWIFARLCEELGFKSALDAVGEGVGEDGDPPLFGRIDHMLGSSGLSLDALQERPGGVAMLPGHEDGRFFEDWIQTDDKRVDCCPPLFADALLRCETIFAELDAEPRDRLKLISLREASMHNSWYQNVGRFVRGRRTDNPLHLHPEDARARGLAEGDAARIESAWGEVRGLVHLDESLMPGVAAMTHGWGNQGSTGMQVARRHPGVNPNALLPHGPGSFEPLSNQAFMTGIPVDVEADPGERT